jgi:hypothetical protein
LSFRAENQAAIRYFAMFLYATREAKMGTQTRHRGPVQLRFDGGKVVVTPEDQDRFVLAADTAVEACQLMNAGLQLRQRFADEFLARVFQWCQQFADRVSACYVAMRDGTLTVFVIVSREEYDFGLDDPLSDLEAEMEEKGWSSDFIQLPNGDADSRRAFFEEEKSIEIYAKRS